eukprot:CAMPEP_0118715736 /NCGR_PEP_ID=MMETSP0800-20121206/27067_1 /TAXON_ID=210618 ORGANISM="Striatella unipunctata, Strain CCMP2910" /NCGR_SAMPLE_ID=MMETSP0800 /ASSEMBLY_ACC=CAM_ASM_000638 /LENGTH=145 /DNA_ID=CAMNT_0006621991 /DNA_START=158 /DNA_END=595 /DNA_ORIENTATION=-
MYNKIYDKFVNTKIAERLDSPIWCDHHRNEVSESMAFGKQVDTVLTHPDHLIFVDETGKNTSQKDDGKICSQRHLLETNTKVEQESSTTNRHFTVLGFTAATGEPVICAVIIASAKLAGDVVLGFDLLENITDLEEFKQAWRSKV